MNFNEFLLTKLAEEASEVTKQALKIAEFGADSDYLGISAAAHLQAELDDLNAVAQFLGQRSFIKSALPDENDNLLDWHPTVQAKGRAERKIRKICWYATAMLDANTLTVLDYERDFITKQAALYNPDRPWYDREER